MAPEIQKAFLIRLMDNLREADVGVLIFRLPSEERPTSQELADLHRLLVDLWIKATNRTLDGSFEYDYAIAVITWMQSILAQSYGFDNYITGLVKLVSGRRVPYQVAAQASVKTFSDVTGHIGPIRTLQELRNPAGRKLVLAMLEQA